MRKRVLVVEDSEPLREMVAKALRRNGYFVFTAAEGEEGLAHFLRFSPDLVITDLMMPEKDGMQLIAAIRRLSRQTKILAMSGYDGGRRADLLKLVRRFGADEILNKPFELTRLIETVKGCTGGEEHLQVA